MRGRVDITPELIDEFVESEYYNPLASGDRDERVSEDVATDVRAESMPIIANWFHESKERASKYVLPPVPSETNEPEPEKTVESKPPFWKEKTKVRARAVVASMFMACLFGGVVRGLIAHEAVGWGIGVTVAIYTLVFSLRIYYGLRGFRQAAAARTTTATPADEETK